MRKIELTEISAFAMYASIDDRGGRELKGIYLNENVAKVESKDAGWWGSPGTVEPITVWHDGEFIYTMNIAGHGHFIDESTRHRQFLMERIKEKLSKEELSLLGIKTS